MLDKDSVAYTLLDNALRNNKLSQVYLFYGNESSLKKESAYHFAYSILQNKSNYVEVEDDFYRRMLNGGCPDFLTLSGQEESIKTEDIEKLLKELQKTALEKGGRRVYLIDKVENSSIKVLKTLLKFIEETPGDNTYGILITDHIETLLETVVSRCERVPFLENELKQIISQYLEDGFDEEDAYYLAKINGLYLKTDLNDPNYLLALDFLNQTLEAKDYEELALYIEKELIREGFKSTKIEAKKVLTSYIVMALETISALYDEEASVIKNKALKLKNKDYLRLFKALKEIETVTRQVKGYDSKLLLGRFIYELNKKGENNER